MAAAAASFCCRRRRRARLIGCHVPGVECWAIESCRSQVSARCYHRAASVLRLTGFGSVMLLKIFDDYRLHVVGEGLAHHVYNFVSSATAMARLYVCAYLTSSVGHTMGCN